MSKRQSLVVFISLGLLALMLWLIDFENLLIRLKGFSLAAIAGIFSLFLVNIFVVSFRFWRVSLSRQCFRACRRLVYDFLVRAGAWATGDPA